MFEIYQCDGSPTCVSLSVSLCRKENVRLLCLLHFPSLLNCLIQIMALFFPPVLRPENLSIILPEVNRIGVNANVTWQD